MTCKAVELFSPDRRAPVVPTLVSFCQAVLRVLGQVFQGSLDYCWLTRIPSRNENSFLFPLGSVTVVWTTSLPFNLYS